MLSTPASTWRSGSSRFDEGIRAGFEFIVVTPEQKFEAGADDLLISNMIVARRFRRYSIVSGVIGDDPGMLRSFFAVFALLAAYAAPAMAEEPPRSECLAMANAAPWAMPVSLRRVANEKAGEVA